MKWLYTVDWNVFCLVLKTTVNAFTSLVFWLAVAYLLYRLARRK